MNSKHFIIFSGILLMFTIKQSIAQEDFEQYYDQVYQIRVISPEAGSKSSIGSGFQVSTDGLIITNYHVISSFIKSPDTHSIEYRSHAGETGVLEVLDFDLINDLALLQHPNPSENLLTFADLDLKKADLVYALGNPRDFGTTLVTGHNNGLVEHSYDDQILFSGSLNPGMSGGPAINKEGNVVGVNVATAGSQLSFLVPANKAEQLVNSKRTLAESDYQLELSSQLKTWQTDRLQQLIDSDWQVESFSGLPLFGEIRKDFQCWGRTNEDNLRRNLDSVSKSCRTGDYVYVNSNLLIGEISFSFSKQKPLEPNSLRFVNSTRSFLSGDSYSDYQYSTNYRCHSDFISEKNTTEDGFTRVTTCIRAHKKLLALYDSLFLVEQVYNNEKLVGRFSISAAEQHHIQKLNEKFLREML